MTREYRSTLRSLCARRDDLLLEAESLSQAISAIEQALKVGDGADEKTIMRRRIAEFGSQGAYADHLGISQARVSGMLGWKTKPLPEHVRRDLGLLDSGPTKKDE